MLIRRQAAADRLTRRANGEEKHSDSPDHLEATPAFPPLVKEREGEDERQKRCQCGQQDSDGHLFPLNAKGTAVASGVGLGWDELVRVAVEAVAQAEARRFSGDRHRAHDLAHVGQAAEQMAASSGPRAEMLWLRMELVRT